MSSSQKFQSQIGDSLHAFITSWRPCIFAATAATSNPARAGISTLSVQKVYSAQTAFIRTHQKWNLTLQMICMRAIFIPRPAHLVPLLVRFQTYRTCRMSIVVVICTLRIRIRHIYRWKAWWWRWIMCWRNGYGCIFSAISGYCIPPWSGSPCFSDCCFFLILVILTVESTCSCSCRGGRRSLRQDW